jgi:hypothetical protein
MQGRVRVRHKMLNGRLKLGDPLPGQPPQHHAAGGYFLGVCTGDAAHHQEW